MLKSILDWLWSKWRGQPPAPPSLPAPPPLPAEEPPAVVQEEEDDNEKFKLEFSLRKNVLNELDMHFKVLHRFKQADRTAFDLYSQIGCYLTPADAVASGIKELAPWFNKTRPAFGAASIVGTKEHAASGKCDRILPRFVYFTKYNPAKAPPNIERTNQGDVYVMTLYYDDLKHGGIRLPASFPVVLLPDGTIHPLRQMMHSTKKVRHKHNGRKQRRGEMFSIPTSGWCIPDSWKEMAHENNHGDSKDEIGFLTDLFVCCANFYEVASLGGMMRVDVAKDNLHLALNVDPKYSARFFNDRDKSYLPNGSTKRIFHIVRAHKRIVKGVEKYIRFHFRGERRFEWNGYSVEITVPFRDGVGIAEVDIAAQDYDKDEPLPSGMVDTKQLGKKLQQWSRGTQ
jgi:hypothetical protein